ncbi:Rrf2 family transcriptional regulator [Notoacmeibacter sp. MSK16QG-6]|uniref:RrF2 family transcriptional regulator n=1 Tax=Notoacmeibacter sp. MSK16QG-6 TaxID=2957982 RepID=UPI00209DC338|nr:Rrf2 family transcriptional regulator [Notoacmeibacter sp. MSK16QG-6]MCP1199642.1 Rrf2 family transcriptional regulator [Notoacmeibacter sp. MSK16QG-6]
MRLTVQTDYALRILMALAAVQPKHLSVSAMAERFDVSGNHLMKTAQTLIRHGYLEAVRGRGGGVRLAQPAGEVVISDVVRAVEPDFAIVECFQKPGCCFLPECRLKSLLAEARLSFLSTLATETLAGLVDGAKVPLPGDSADRRD